MGQGNDINQFIPVDDFLRFTRAVPENLIGDLNIQATLLGKAMVMFTLYGRKIEEFLMALVKTRAIDQKRTAEHLTKSIFSVLFKPEVQPKFSVRVLVSKDIYIAKICKLALKLKDEKALLQELESRPEEYYKYEIDACIYLSMRHEVQGSMLIEKLVEIKLFTVPPEDNGRVLIRHLQRKALVHYFSIRDYLGLMGFSYMVVRGTGEYVKVDDVNNAYFGELPSVWAVHLIMLDRRILGDGLNAPARARLILDGMNAHCNQILFFYQISEKINFRPTSNLLKVVIMSQLYFSLKRDYDKVRRKYDTVKQEYDTVKQEYDTVKQEYDTVKQELENNRRVLEDYKRRLTEYKKMLETERKNRESLERRIMEIEKHLKERGIDL
ncbi:MAG: hypothetical protein ACTSWN_12480 [Promethearchaeota archaeon]